MRQNEPVRCYTKKVALKLEWRNWQTHGTQNPAPSRACGFDPHLQHHPTFTPPI